jgi:hypothetical protein
LCPSGGPEGVVAHCATQDLGSLLLRPPATLAKCKSQPMFAATFMARSMSRSGWICVTSALV